MMTPRRYLVRMGIFLVLALVLGGLLFQPLLEAFVTNPWLNGLIFGVLAFGIVFCFQGVMKLYPEINWIEGYRRNEPALSVRTPPRLLAPMATLLRDRERRVTLSAMAMRSLLDGIGSRLDEERDITRYTIGLLIFLGLLGTFWGLLLTISSLGGVIGSLTVGTGDVGIIFDQLKQGIAAPLAGMGTAFSTSLFGLAGSLIVGFLDLQASQAQNRFYNELEDWLSSLTRLTAAGPLSEGEQSVPAYVQALLEQTADSLDKLQRIMARSEETRVNANTTLMALTEKLATLTDQMRTEQTLMMKLAENQMEIRPLLARLADVSSRAPAGMDEATKSHVRNIDVYVARLVEDVAAGRSQLIEELRSEIKMLARTFAAAAEETRKSDLRRER